MSACAFWIHILYVMGKVSSPRTPHLFCGLYLLLGGVCEFFIWNSRSEWRMLFKFTSEIANVWSVTSSQSRLFSMWCHNWVCQLHMFTCLGTLSLFQRVIILRWMQLLPRYVFRMQCYKLFIHKCLTSLFPNPNHYCFISISKQVWITLFFQRMCQREPILFVDY